MGIAGSKASEADAVDNQTATSGFPNAQNSHIHGAKRRHEDEPAPRSPKRRKAVGVSGAGSGLRGTLAFRSPRPESYGSSSAGGAIPVIEETSKAPPKSTNTQAVRGSAALEKTTTSRVEDSSTTNPEVAIEADVRQSVVISSDFHHTIQYLRQESEEVPSGWAVAKSAPLSASVREHNCAMIQRAVLGLQGVHLTSTYSQENLQLSNTTLPPPDRNLASRASKKDLGLLFGPAADEIQDGGGNKLGPVAVKRPRTDNISDAGRRRKRVRKTLGGETQAQQGKMRTRKLSGIWRKDKLAGWSGLLRSEF